MDRVRVGIRLPYLPEACSLSQLWPALRVALHGCYLLTMDLCQTRLVLEQEALRFGLESLVLIGDDLLIWAIHYYQPSGRTSLSSLCELIGHLLPPDASITLH